MDCSIVRVDAESGVELVARVFSAVATRIRYCFVVAQKGHAGEARLAELGEIEIHANRSVDFGHTLLTLCADSVYDARLVVRWETGEVECELLPPVTGLVH